jgi:hypothetical protein
MYNNLLSLWRVKMTTPNALKLTEGLKDGETSAVATKYRISYSQTLPNLAYAKLCNWIYKVQQ